LTTISHHITIVLNPLPRFFVISMPYLKFPQFSANGQHHQSHDALSAHPQGGVVQEKVALSSDRKSTTQPAAGTNGVRSPDLNTKAVRLQSQHTPRRPKVPFTLHIDPLVKSDVERQAELDGISASREGADLLEEMLHQKLHQRKAATLGSVIEAIIDRKFSQRDDRLASLLLGNLLAIEETRYIQANMFSRMPGVTTAMYDAFMDKAAKEARRKLARRKEQRTHLREMMQELQDILAAPEEAEEQEPPPPGK
jgi:hypothetical protein